MIRVYEIPTEIVNGVQRIKAEEFIHKAIVDFSGDIAIVLQDTDDAQHTEFIKVAKENRNATPEETKRLQDMLASLSPEIPYRDLVTEIDQLKADVRIIKTDVESLKGK